MRERKKKGLLHIIILFKLCVTETLRESTLSCTHSMCAWMYVLVPHTIQRANGGICLQDCEHAFKCTHSGEKVRLNKWEIFTHVWAKVHTHSTSHSCDTLHTVSEVRRLKIVPSPSRHLARIFQATQGESPFIQPSDHCNTAGLQWHKWAVLPANQQLVTGQWKNLELVCLGMCGEGVKLVPVLGSAGNTVYCSCCQKKTL